MAFATTTQWDVRTTGSDSNGGGFNSALTGVDYSQQNSPQFVYSDLVIGATNTQITSAARPFVVNRDEGNIINILSGTGFTVQRVQIVSVSGNVATCDKAVGTASSTGGGGNLGGSLLTLPTVLALAVSLNTVHLQSGTYIITASINMATIALVGYQTSHWDGGTRPLITASTNFSQFFVVNSGSSGQTLLFQNISTSWTGGFHNSFVANLASNGLNVYCIGCKFVGFSGVINGLAGVGFNRSVSISCEASGLTSFYTLAVTEVEMIACNLHDNTTSGVVQSSGGTLISIRCEYANNTNGVLYPNGGRVIAIENTFYANGTAIQSQSPLDVLDGIIAIDNIFYGQAAWAINLASATSTVYLLKNAYGANATGNWIHLAAEVNPILLTANPFTDAPNGDLSLNNLSGGGALCRGAGYPGALPGGLSVGYPDLGALQAAGVVSSGSKNFGFVS